jgi:polysaccharide deacetylase family protein (PEP-CTERM system associated)
MSIDVEDWFHILDCPQAPDISHWEKLECRLEPNLDRLLDLLDRHRLKATFFWLGWEAERHKPLVLRCLKAGHEIASHGYAHVLAFKVGRRAFAEDVRRSKQLLEDITGGPVTGIRVAGFSTTQDTPWTFEEIRAAGFVYDSSIFPSRRGHGGLRDAPLEPQILHTAAGPLAEIPQSMLEFGPVRVSLFGGGYLRLAPLWLIHWGVRRLAAQGRPLVVYLHPREIDPHHPRLPLNWQRRFKCYVNLKSTLPKLKSLCALSNYLRMDEFAQRMLQQPPNG